MRPLPAYVTADFAGAPAPTVAWRATRPVTVEIADAARLGDLRDYWVDLLARADAPNIFMDPELLHAVASAHSQMEFPVLLAWSATGERRLLGVWGFAIGSARRSVLRCRVLIAPACPHGYLATPVLDRAELDSVLDAMLDAVAANPQLPKIITLDSMGHDGATMAALSRVLAGRGTQVCEFAHYQRPKLVTGLDGKSYFQQAFSSSTRKKLRQQRRRLAEKGALVSVIHREPQAVRKAAADFLNLEAAGWKGQRGTAINCNAREAEFVSRTIATLTHRQQAEIHAIELDGQPIAIQIVLRAGRTAFTWKTTYDERFRDFSPGMLLLEDYTTALLADPTIEYVDSCSYDDSGFMSAWQHRKAVADLWIDTRRNGSLEFLAFGILQKVYRHLRAAARETYLAVARQRKR